MAGAVLFHLPASGTADVSPTPSATDWDGHINSISRPMTRDNKGTTLTVEDVTPDAADHLTDVSSLVAQFVSEVFPPASILAQTVVCMQYCREANAGNNQVMRWKVYVVNAAGTSVLATLVAIKSSTGELDAGTPVGEIDTAAVAAVDIDEPWRMVFEIGSDGLPVATSGVQGHNVSFYFGESINSYPQDADTTQGNPHLWFKKGWASKIKGTVF